MSLRELGTELIDDSTPEDVAALYRWANLTGAKYRDYSAERREQRARMRYRSAKQQLEKELEIQVKAGVEGSAKRVQEARRAEAAAQTALRIIEEEHEIAEAHESARRKQEAFDQAERLRHERTGQLPSEKAGPGESVRPTASPASDIEEQRVEAPKERMSEVVRPAWLEPAAELAWPEEAATNTALPMQAAQATWRSVVPETLLDSREQVALRWPALQTLAQELRLDIATTRMSQRRGPVTAIVSPAGGAGGTSLAAMLARAFAKDGERVLLVEATAQGLLPLYFGLGPLEPGELHTVAAREGESGGVSILAMDADALVAPDATDAQTKRMQSGAVEELLSKALGHDRVVIDLASGAEWMVQRLAVIRPMVLAPVAPELNSVAGLRKMERTFASITDSEGRSLLPFYVLNRFDAALPLHLDIREVLRREMDGRLLSVAVRRSAAVGEALAEGTTVLDYAADASVARDYTDVARWLQEAAAASAEAIADAARGGR